MLALRAGISPAARQRMGVAMRIKKRASQLSWLGREVPKKAGLKAALPWMALSNATRLSRCLKVKIAPKDPNRQLKMPTVVPQIPKIAAMLKEEAPIDWRIAISFLLSFTRRRRSEMILEQATIRIIAAMRRKRVRSL